MVLQIENCAHERQGKAISNFSATLPPADSDMAEQVFKDPYLFDSFSRPIPDENAKSNKHWLIISNSFCLSLGPGSPLWAGRFWLEVGDQDFYLDLLFYHLKLRCYIVIELKVVPFDPAFVGQLNLYLSATDDLLRHPDDNPSIGLLICHSERTRSSWSMRCEISRNP